MSESKHEPVLLVYDRQCPLCEAYCRRVSVDGRLGELRIVDARAPSAIRDRITSAGLDIDQGMVLEQQGVLYYGSEAIHRLALLSGRGDPFNRLTHLVFRSRRRSRALYPLLRMLRNLLLKLLGRRKINNLGIPGNERF